jgi:hypothetical protein
MHGRLANKCLLLSHVLSTRRLLVRSTGTLARLLHRSKARTILRSFSLTIETTKVNDLAASALVGVRSYLIASSAERLLAGVSARMEKLAIVADASGR